MRKREGKLIKGGEKATARGVRTEVVRILNRVYPGQGREVREEALKGVQPVVETRRVKRAGRGYPVPHVVKASRGRTRAATWVREAAKGRGKKHRRRRADARVRERRTVYEERKRVRGGEEKGGGGRSEALAQRNRRHKEARANRVYTQMRWY